MNENPNENPNENSNYFDRDHRFDDCTELSEGEEKAREILDYIVEMMNGFIGGYDYTHNTSLELNTPPSSTMEMKVYPGEKILHIDISDQEAYKIVKDAFLRERMQDIVAKAGARSVALTSRQQNCRIEVHPKKSKDKKRHKELEFRSGVNPLRSKTRTRLTRVMKKVIQGDFTNDPESDEVGLNIDTSTPRRLMSQRVMQIVGDAGLTVYDITQKTDGGGKIIREGKIIITRIKPEQEERLQEG